MVTNMSETYFKTTYSLGWTVEILAPGKNSCSSWLLLPAENLWPIWLRGSLYFLAMLYIFLGIAIASDVFVCSIEKITSKIVTVTKVDPVTGVVTKSKEYFWNETVANLTLMSLGSSAPEILLASVEAISHLHYIDSDKKVESLGLFTICGSAAFNLFTITGICIMSVSSPDVKIIKERAIFVMNSLWSIFAYVWLLLVCVFISPKEIEPWEAWVTILFFPIMVVTAYCQNKKWWYRKWGCIPRISNLSNGQVKNNDTEPGEVELNNIRPVDRKSIASAASSAVGKMAGEQDDGTNKKYEVKMITPKTRFTHAKFTNVMGVDSDHKKKKQIDESKLMSQISLNNSTDKNLIGKFAFKTTSYNMLESEGKITIPVLFYRIYPLPEALKESDKLTDTLHPDIALTVKGVAEVDFETCDGSAKVNEDYIHTSGTLKFEEHECCKTVTVSIIDDPDYEANKDFYVILKKPAGSSHGISENSITKITIIDDDDPGEFSFDKERYYSDENSIIHIKILRKNGCDGTANMQMTSSNKTAIGGKALKYGTDYIAVQDSIVFRHEEKEMKFDIETNPKTEKKKLFNISLGNFSDGCRPGEITTAVCVVGLVSETSEDDSDDEDPSWPDQFRNAMTLDRQFDESGEETQGGFMVYLLHFCSFFWRFVCAFIPPRRYLGAYPTFFGSLVILGTMTSIVEQLGNLLGCVLGIKTEVTGITIVAIGTSLQDTFASRAAAMQSETADESIGHITGSNAVNVFLGLGIPWVISSMYATIRKKPYCVTPNNLFQSIIVFLSLAALAISTLIFRRFVFKGELGGTRRVKFGFGFMFVTMWIIYIIALSIISYDEHVWKFDVENGRCH